MNGHSFVRDRIKNPLAAKNLRNKYDRICHDNGVNKHVNIYKFAYYSENNKIKSGKSKESQRKNYHTRCAEGPELQGSELKRES